MIYILTIISFLVFERRNLFDSIYFVVVTTTTVGYGDIIPTHYITKTMVILLIVMSILTVAITYESIVETIVKRNELKYGLPKQALDYKGHCIIAGITPISRILAHFLSDRGLIVVMVDPDLEDIKLARTHGHEAYHSEMDKPEYFESLGIKEADVCYTFFEEDNYTINLAVFLRDITSDLKLFSSTSKQLNIKFGNFIGIKRTYHEERVISSFIKQILILQDFYIPPNQNSAKGRFTFFIDFSNKLQERYPTAILIGKINPHINQIRLNGFVSQAEFEKFEDKKLLAIPKSALNEKKLPELNKTGRNFRNIYIGGFSDRVADILEHLDNSMKIKRVLVFQYEELELAKLLEVDVTFIKKKNFETEILPEISNDDLIINLFTQITDSLFITFLLRKNCLKTTIFQLADGTKETEVYRKAGVDWICDPHAKMSEAMFLIYMSDPKFTTSIVFQKQHIFEHYVEAGDKFIGVDFRKLRKNSYNILVYYDKNSQRIIQNPKTGKASHGDTVIVTRNEV